MPTAETADMLCFTAGLALQIVEEGPWMPPSDGAASVVVVVVVALDTVHVHKKGDPIWVKPDDLALADSWFHYKAGVSEHAGCIVLSDKKQTVNTFHFLDARCPTLPIVWGLKRRGWRPVNAIQNHTTTEICIFDSVEATKMNTYYQVVRCLDRCLPLSSNRIPSREPIHYYKLLLADHRVEPGLPNKEYLALWNSEEVKKGRDPVPLEDEDSSDHEPLPDPDDDDVAVPIGPGPKKAPKTRKTDAPKRGPIPIEPPPIIIGPGVPPIVDPPPTTGVPSPRPSTGPPVPPVDPLHLAPRSLFMTRPKLGDYINTKQELQRRANDIFKYCYFSFG